VGKKAGQKILRQNSNVNPLKQKMIKNIPFEKVYKEVLDEYLKTGEFIQAIAKVQKKYGDKLPFDTVRGVCLKISEYAKEMCENIFEEVIFKHAIIYNNIYRYCRNTGFGIGVNKALQYKERLLGINSEDETLIINNEFDVVVGEGFDFSLLTDEERVRMEQLVLKCKPLKQLQK